jgi:hypothetical protein
LGSIAVSEDSFTRSEANNSLPPQHMTMSLPFLAKRISRRKLHNSTTYGQHVDKC